MKKVLKSVIKIRCFKLPFIGLHSKLMQKKIDQLFKRFCKSLKVKLVFTIEKLRCPISTKDPYKNDHLSKVTYKFVCAGCNASYVGQTCRHLATTIDEHFGKDKKSHIYQHLMSSKDCLDNCSKDCFTVLDTANTKHQLKIKESLYITWLRPILNKQKQYQYVTSLSFQFHFFLFFFFSLSPTYLILLFFKKYINLEYLQFLLYF